MSTSTSLKKKASLAKVFAHVDVEQTGFVSQDEWKEILIEYQDKLLFATDAHKKHRWKKYSKIVRIYRDILNQLPEEVAKKIAYLNAARIYDIKN